MTSDRRVTLELDEEDLADLAMALKHRMSILVDARPGFRCPMGGTISQAAERVSDLQARVAVALKQLRKMPGGGQ